MNYLKQLTTFYKHLMTVSLSANAQALYTLLLFINNSTRWKKKFNAPNSTVMAYMGISLSTLRRLRTELIENGFLKYDSGNKKTAGTYEIVKLYKEACDENDI